MLCVLIVIRPIEILRPGIEFFYTETLLVLRGGATALRHYKTALRQPLWISNFRTAQLGIY